MHFPVERETETEKIPRQFISIVCNMANCFFSSKKRTNAWHSTAQYSTAEQSSLNTKRNGCEVKTLTEHQYHKLESERQIERVCNSRKNSSLTSINCRNERRKIVLCVGLTNSWLLLWFFLFCFQFVSISFDWISVNVWSARKYALQSILFTIYIELRVSFKRGTHLSTL